MSPENARKLHELISSLFTTPELRSWVWLYEAARPVYDALPSELAPKYEVVQALLVGLANRGLVNDALFGALLEVRPKREDDVNVVAALLGCTPCSTGYGGAPLKSLSRLEQVVALEELLLEREWHLLDRRFPVDLGARIDGLVSNIMAGGRSKAGDVVANARLIKPVGNGNFATVWLAVDEAGREVAVKVFHLEKLGEGVMLWRFRRSIRALTHLADDRRRPISIAPLLAMEPHGLAFSMPYLSGGNLEAISQFGWTLPVKLDCFLEICRAVAFAHQVGIIHRDIKPANVLLDANRRPVLTDFDISDIKFATKLSSAGSLGTPIFAAPEQIEEGDQADERSDIYSLGRLLHFMLLASSPGHQIENEPTLKNLHRYPQALVSIVRRACHLAPDKRYQSVQQLIHDLEEYESDWAMARAHTRQAGRWLRTHWALLLIAVGSLTWGWVQQHARVEDGRYMADLARLDELMQRLDMLRAQHVSVSSNIDVLKSNLDGILEQLATPGVSRTTQGMLKSEASTLQRRIAEKEQWIKQLSASMASLENQRQGIRTSHIPTPEPRQEVAEPVLCSVEPEGGPTGKTYSPQVAGLDMMFIGLSKGLFCMGSPKWIGADDERPQHPVEVQSFYFGKSEVTQAQWRVVVKAAHAAGDTEAAALNEDPSYFRGDERPVDGVSWCDAIRFANALSRLEGRSPAYTISSVTDSLEDCTVHLQEDASGYRLPTEAEWEYTARAGTKTAFATGDAESDLAQAGWYGRFVNEVGNRHDESRDVCSAPNNPWGICDLHGNVWEWCFDVYDEMAYTLRASGASPSDSVRSSAPSSGRVLRGGSVLLGPVFSRSASRYWTVPSNSSKDIGLRLLVATPDRSDSVEYPLLKTQ